MIVASTTAFYINASIQNRSKIPYYLLWGCITQSISLWNIAQKATVTSHEKYNILCRMMYCIEPLGIHSCLYCVESTVFCLLLSCKYHCRDLLWNLTVNSDKKENNIVYLQIQLTNSMNSSRTSSSQLCTFWI